MAREPVHDPSPGTEPDAAGTLFDVLNKWADTDSPVYVREDPRSGVQREMTGKALRKAALRAGATLRSRLVPSGGSIVAERSVCLVFADPLDFVVGFFTTLAAGMVPVPSPGLPSIHPGHRERLERILRSSNPAAVLTGDVENRTAVSGSCPVMVLSDLLKSAEIELGDPVAPSETAYIQYTSGSLSAPKPISVGHRGALEHLAQAAAAYREDAESVSVNWVPLYHDMGLVTSILRPLWSGYTSVLLDPYDFVRDPALWPRMMTKWRATHTSAPDFGYALCARKIRSADEFDLRSLRVARSAGETVRPTTLRDFTDLMRPAGFDPAAFAPSYGLAEATLTVTTSAWGEAPKTATVRTDRLQRGEAVPAGPGEPSTEITSCGAPLPGTAVRVLDEVRLRPLDEGRIGEVWISGPGVHAASGNPHEIEGVLGHLTGDLAFVLDGELYLIGRSKERFQIAGENFYSVDLEHVAAGSDARLRPGRTAAFAVQSPCGTQAPIVLAELREGLEPTESELDEIARSVVSALARSGLATARVALVPARTLPITTSGKVRRLDCRDRYERQTIEPLHTYERGRA